MIKMKEKPKFSILIPVKELNSYIKESIPIILNMKYEDYEIIILPNELPKKIPDYLNNRKIRIIETGKVSPAIKRDIGANKSNAEYLAFIDDDAYPEKGWLSVAEEILKQKKRDNVMAVCGPAITPKSDSTVQKSSGLFFETLFGGGGMSYRYKPAKKSFYVDDFPSVNLIVSKDAFLKTGGFKSEFWPGEDTKFCLDFIKRGYKIWYSNELIIYHHRRKSVSEHVRQVSNYGQHRGYFAKVYPETSRKLVYFIPSLFLIENVFFLIVSIFSFALFKIWLVLIGIYFLLLLIDILTKTINFKIVIIALVLTFLSHIGYGAMFINGFFSKSLRSKLR
jgi:GT2 family glycosyltransferase